MQRYYDIVRDSFGNPVSGASVAVYLTGTTTLATLYPASSATDSPTSGGITNPIITGSDGLVAFAANDGDYDLAYSGSNITSYTRVRVNLFDSTTATTIPVSSISLAMPPEFTVSGSPGTSITVSRQTETANTVWAGPTSGGSAVPTFRALVAADVTPVACDLSTNQTVAGNKIWSGTQTFNAAVTHSAAVTNSSTLAQNGNLTMGASTQLVVDKTWKAAITSASSYGWKRAIFCNFGETTGTAPTFNATLTGGLTAISFSAASAQERIFHLGMPLDYAEGTDLYPFVTWTTTGTNTGVVRWGLEYTLGKAYSQTTLPATATIYIETAGSGTALKPVTSEWAAITGSAMEADSVLYVRLFRDAAHVNDTQTDASLLLDFGVHYQTSRPFGSKNKNNPFYT